MSRFTGRFDGRVIVLDDPQSVSLLPETRVEVRTISPVPEIDIHIPTKEERSKALSDFRADNAVFAPLPNESSSNSSRSWTREEFYDETI